MSDVEKKMEEAEEKAAEIKEDVVEEAEETAAEAAEEVEEAAAEAGEEVEEATAEAGEEVEETAAEAGEEAEEAGEEAEETATEAGEEETKSAKQLRKEEKAEKKAEKAAKEAAEAAAAKKKVSTKTVTLITIAICAIAVIGLVAYMNRPEKSLYEKVSDYSKYVKLGDYKGLEYTQEKLKVSAKEVKAEIDNRVQAKATTTDSKKGTVKDGDNVNISYVGKIDGKEFDGGSADNYTLTIGSGSFIDGFEEGLIGKKIGEKVTLDLKFPEDYHNEDVAGKAVTFDVTINSKQVTKTPEYDEKFIKENSDYDNKEDYEASVKKDLEKEKKETAENTAKQSLWSTAVENAEVKKYPKGVVAQEKQSIIDQYKLMAENYNVEWADFLEQYMNTTEEDFDKQAKTYGESVAKQKLVMYAIADKEKISVSNKEYKKKLKELLKNAGMTEEQFQEQYNKTIEEYAEENDFKSQFLLEKLYDFLYKNGKATAPKKEKK